MKRLDTSPGERVEAERESGKTERTWTCPAAHPPEGRDLRTKTPSTEVQVIRNAWVIARDGVRLATTVIPPDGEGPFPVVLVRSVYHRTNSQSTWFAGHGMALVLQDCRGRYASEGEFLPFRDEADDGRDTLAWIRKQPRCNGRIGMFGHSYLAATQFYATRQAGHLLLPLNPRFMAGDCWKRGY